MIALVIPDDQMISLETPQDQMVDLTVQVSNQPQTNTTDFIPWNPAGIFDNQSHQHAPYPMNHQANISLGYHNQNIPMYTSPFNPNPYGQPMPPFGYNNQMIPL